MCMFSVFSFMWCDKYVPNCNTKEIWNLRSCLYVFWKFDRIWWIIDYYYWFLWTYREFAHEKKNSKDLKSYINSIVNLVSCLSHWCHDVDLFCLCLNFHTQMISSTDLFLNAHQIVSIAICWLTEDFIKSKSFVNLVLQFVILTVPYIF